MARQYLGLLYFHMTQSVTLKQGTIKRYCSYFLVREARFYRRISKNGRGFTNQQSIGKDTITKMIREGYMILGIDGWATLKPHALRGHFVSILANVPTIKWRGETSSMSSQVPENQSEVPATGTGTAMQTSKSHTAIIIVIFNFSKNVITWNQETSSSG